MQLTELESTMLQALRFCREGGTLSSGWASVYLDNARVEGISEKQKSALLSNLQQKGLYQHDDEYRGVWGLVKMED